MHELLEYKPDLLDVGIGYKASLSDIVEMYFYGDLHHSLDCAAEVTEEYLKQLEQQIELMIAKEYNEGYAAAEKDYNCDK